MGRLTGREKASGKSQRKITCWRSYAYVREADNRLSDADEKQLDMFRNVDKKMTPRVSADMGTDCSQ